MPRAPDQPTGGRLPGKRSPETTAEKVKRQQPASHIVPEFLQSVLETTREGSRRAERSKSRNYSGGSPLVCCLANTRWEVARTAMYAGLPCRRHAFASLRQSTSFSGRQGRACKWRRTPTCKADKTAYCATLSTKYTINCACRWREAKASCRECHFASFRNIPLLADCRACDGFPTFQPIRRPLNVRFPGLRPRARFLARSAGRTVSRLQVSSRRRFAH